VVGGNVWLTHSVPAGSRITQAMASEAGYDAGAGI
jgi:serine O-acetyltransferase